MSDKPQVLRRGWPLLLLWAGLIGVLTLLAGYVIWVFVSPIDLPFQNVTATIQVTSTVEGHTVHVSGTTDLPDGAVIGYYWWHDIDTVATIPGGLVTVADGRFAFVSDLSAWPAGTATAYISFGVNSTENIQPKPVVDRFGSQGEHLGGPQVHVDSPGDPKQLLVTTSVELHD